MIKQARVVIKGDVTGVGFRAWTKIQAKNIGVTGWVRNEGNSVESLLQGEETWIERMISQLKKGSPVSQVDDVQVTWETPTKIFASFEIAY